MDFDRSYRFRNFGRNVSFDARCYFEPRTEQEVLDLLREHEGQRFRAVGALHSWSDAPVGRDVILNLRHISGVRLISTEGQTYAEIGAGCTVHSALDRLHEHGLTLPAIGMTDAQSIAGAISTATHGSGRSSMSHYVTAVRIAAYDADGVPTVREVTEGPALRAARCALGRMGIVLSIQLQCVPTYRVEETSKMLDSIDDVLSEAREHPLTQFYLMPWSWTWIAEFRRQVDRAGSKTWEKLRYRMIRGFSVAMLNAVTVLFARWGNSKVWIRRIHRQMSRGFISRSVVDRAEHVLMIAHRQKYVEAELFVPVDRVRAAAKLIEEVLRFLAGDAPALSADVHALVAGRVDELERLRGSYVHHYPITFRHVLQDSTLISMSSDEAMFAISLVTMSRDLKPFEATVDLLSSTMARTLRARPHWGKVITLGKTELNGLIPGMRSFREECDRVDPNGAFASEFTRRVLGF